MKVPRRLESYRVECGTYQILDSWYNQLEQILQENRYHPSLMCNMDETMLACKEKKTKVIIPKERKTGIQIVDKGAEHITLVVTCFADGPMAKTGVILPLQTLPIQLESIVKDFAWSGNSTGWITAEIFQGWVQNVLIPDILDRRAKIAQENTRALLLIDSHSSRECPEALRLLNQSQIDVFTFEPHVTHLCQPLDCGPFSIFKRKLSVLKSTLSGINGPDRREKLLKIAKQALFETGYPESLQNAWANVGICPFNKDKVLEKDEVVRSETTESQTSRKRGIKITGTKITDEPIIRAIEERKAKKLEKEANKGTKPRGRPKGSKNKPKTVAPIDLEAENAISE